MSDRDSALWQEAEAAEMKSHAKNGTWELVSLACCEAHPPGTAKLGLSFQRSTPASQSPGLVVYVDADFAEDKDTRRSRTGYVLQYAGATVSCNSSLQRIVSLSTAEAEYMAAGSCAQEVVWFRSLLAELGYPQRDPTVIFEDNTSCIAMLLKTGCPSRGKHIDIRHHWLQEKVENRESLFQWT